MNEYNIRELPVKEPKKYNEYNFNRFDFIFGKRPTTNDNYIVVEETGVHMGMNYAIVFNEINCSRNCYIELANQTEVELIEKYEQFDDENPEYFGSAIVMYDDSRYFPTWSNTKICFCLIYDDASDYKLVSKSVYERYTINKRLERYGYYNQSKLNQSGISDINDVKSKMYELIEKVIDLDFRKDI